MEPPIRETPDRTPLSPASKDPRTVLKDLHGLASHEIINRILDSEYPERVVQALPSQDFFWLIKRIGTEDCLPVLQLASVEQWQFLLDLELWRRDRLDQDQSGKWLEHLVQADAGKLVQWLFTDGQPLAYLHFLRSVELTIIHDAEEVNDLPAGFFTLDGVFYVRAKDPNQRETIESILRELSARHFERYQAFLLGLGSVLPAEMEEESYRLRNTRLAEHGFLPFEEAISVYAPLPLESLAGNEERGEGTGDPDPSILAMIPAAPLEFAGTRNLLTEVAGRIPDAVFLDRLRLEFAGLCNQIFSADGIPFPEMDTMMRVCRKAASYVNLAIEKISGHDMAAAMELLKSTHLPALFRVGFGLALKVKREAEHWVAGSWFTRQGLPPGFWGETWGGILSGLLQKRPHLYIEHAREEPFKDFEWISELGDCLLALRRLMVMDALLERIAARYPLNAHRPRAPESTFLPLLFTLWGRSELGLGLSFSGISQSEVKRLFQRLRGRTLRAPHPMPGAEERFVRFFLGHASPSDDEAASVLREALVIVWNEFAREYEGVAVEALAGKYMHFFAIVPDGGGHGSTGAGG